MDLFLAKPITLEGVARIMEQVLGKSGKNQG
jgi:hypothetical protein